MKFCEWKGKRNGTRKWFHLLDDGAHSSSPFISCTTSIKDCVDHRASEISPDIQLRCGENLLWFGFQDLARREQKSPAEASCRMHAPGTVLPRTEPGFAVSVWQPGSQQIWQLQDYTNSPTSPHSLGNHSFAVLYMCKLYAYSHTSPWRQ